MHGDRTTPEGVEVESPGRWEAAADWTWGIIRRVHLGTREPANWVQLFHFAVVGGSGYVVNLIVFSLLTGLTDVNHLLAAVGAFVVAVTNNFLLNRHWTFRRQGSTESHAGFQAARFFTVSLVGLGRQPGRPRAADLGRRAAGAGEPGDRGRGRHPGQLHRQQALDLRSLRSAAVP